MVVKLREAAVLPDPEAGRTRIKQSKKRQADLTNLVEKYNNLLHGLPGVLLQSQLGLSVSMSDNISNISI